MLGMSDDLDRELRQEALQIALQLPKDRDCALRVLQLAQHLVTDFLDREPSERRLTLVPFARPSADR